MIRRVSTNVLNIIHNATITALAPKKSPTANLNTVIALIESDQLIIDKTIFTNIAFNNEDTITTKYKNL